MYKKIDYFISVLRQSFIELLPYMVLMSILIISIQLISIFNLDLPVLQNDIIIFTETISKFLPILLIIIISVNISKIYNINISIGIFSSLLVYILYSLMKNNYKFNLDGLLTIYSLLIPFITLKFLNILINISIFKNIIILNENLKKIFTLIFPFIIVVFTTSIFLYYLNSFLQEYILLINNYIIELPSMIFLFLYNLFSHLFWFIGIHGVTAAALFFDTSIMDNDILPNISNSNFMNLFTVFGGAGSGLALAIAILINGKNAHWSKISKLSFPFVIFNINEILIYGLPIVFNKYLFIPFVFVPLINFIIAYNIISHKLVEFTLTDVHWAMPIFVNAYLSTDGSYSAIILQVILLIISIVIYLPFVNKYAKVQNKFLLRNTLDESLNIADELQYSNSINNEQINLITKYSKASKAIDLITSNELLLYYQPKVNIKTNTCNDFEVLLRLKLSNNDIISPHFLSYIENNDYIKSLDYWVVKQLKVQFNIWKVEDFYPHISLNLHPITLSDKGIILKIISFLKNENVNIEIIEKAYLNKEAKENIILLKNNGFNIIIDDFGIGFSNLSSLYENNISIIKFDKSLIDKIDNDNMYKICNHIANLCEELNIDVVAEGVETKKQYDIISKTKIKYIQGYYFSKALPAEKLNNYNKSMRRPLQSK